MDHPHFHIENMEGLHFKIENVEQCGCFVEHCGCNVEQCVCNVNPPHLHISQFNQVLSPLRSVILKYASLKSK